MSSMAVEERPHLFKLGGEDGHQAIPTHDALDWAMFFEWSERRIVRRTEIMAHVRVSTVFLGMHQGWLDDDEPPVVFETMVFDDTPIERRIVNTGDRQILHVGAKPTHGVDMTQVRYCTWEEAVAGHEAIVEMVRVVIGRNLLPERT